MQGVLAAAQHRHVLSTVEKGIAGGATAHTVPLQPGKARDARHRPGGACGQNDGVRRVIFIHCFYGEFIRIGQAHRFGRDELHAQTSGVFHAAAFQLRTGDRLGKAVVVFNFFGAVKGTGAFGEHRGIHTGADSVQSSGNARRAGTDNDNAGHEEPPPSDAFFYSIHLFLKNFRDRVAKHRFFRTVLLRFAVSGSSHAQTRCRTGIFLRGSALFSFFRTPAAPAAHSTAYRPRH